MEPRVLVAIVVLGLAVFTVVAIVAIIAFVASRRSRARRASQPMSSTSEDRTFVGIPSGTPRSDATMVGTTPPRSDATVVDVRTSAAAGPAPSAPMAAAAQQSTATPGAAPSDAPTIAVSVPPPAPEAATLPTLLIPKLRARVTVTKGGSGTHELEPREHTIGRSTHADIVLADPSVSGHHAKLAPRGDAFVLTDLGSTNGTTVDGRPVQGEYVLRGGETVGIGDARLRYERLA